MISFSRVDFMSSSSHGWCRRFFKWVGEREREIWAEREREIWAEREREREREMCTEMGSSIVMYNFGVGPRGPYKSANLEGHQR